MLRKIVNKKVKGASSYISTCICIFMMFIFFMILLYAYGEAVARDDVRRIHRKYLLSMEIEGCLSDAKEALLRAELASEGMVNIDLSGTSMTPVGYGNQVRLVINGDLPVSRIGFAGGNASKQEVRVHVYEDDTGTALY